MAIFWKMMLLLLAAVLSINIAAGKEIVTHESENEICNQELETGDCRAIFSRYGYDTKLGDCKMFEYGGCGGNTNNFKTMEECRQKCVPMQKHV
eukprot:gene8763-9697_t